MLVSSVPLTDSCLLQLPPSLFFYPHESIKGFPLSEAIHVNIAAYKKQ